MARRGLFIWLTGAAMAMAPIGAQAQGPAPAAAPTGAIGTWVNPHGTVKVATGNCAGKLCGWVVWASAEAQADAQENGVTRLVGTELLQSYHATGTGQWQGQVYVPDMGHRYYSTIAQIDRNNLKISGCILGGLICKSQVWQRG